MNRNHLLRPLLCFFLVCQFSIFAQAQENVIPTKVKEVTVFLSQAELFHQEQTILKKGENQLIFRGISPHYVKESVQIAGKGDFTILSVKPQVNYLEQKNASKEFQKLQDSVRFYKEKLNEQKDEKDVLQKEVEMMVKNQQISGTNQTLTATQLKEMADFMRRQLLQTKARLRELTTEEQELSQNISRLQTQMNSISTQRKLPVGEVVVEIESKMEQKAEFRLKYLVDGAVWIPLYDLRASAIGKPIELAYKAQVAQQTGVDWEKVKLYISTINPTLGATKPENPTRWLTLYSHQKQSKQRLAKQAEASSPSLTEAEVAMGFGADDLAGEDDWGSSETAADYTTSKETPFATTFEIKLPYTIPSDGRVKVVEVQNSELPASFVYAAVPAAENAAFLVAYVTDWRQYNLVSGKANIYFENGFVGETEIETSEASDSLLLSMGRDTRLLIERKALKDYNKRKFVGTQVRESKGFEISLKNNRSETIEVEVEDYIPLSMDSRITVETDQLDGASYDAQTGRVVWKLKLSGGESKKLKFGYTLKYPKGMNLKEEIRD
ncbi:DUF4139 domain-containing protein [Hugenholtzia roseola]|uniref:DUF4139 domain-containing protein n=1 Tax=Hugenholtzia roseola TaxID=1002 RepID=UPI0012B6578F|nr:DUF4139 domain-containing protein [Hugenholtzia roseola]